MPEIYMIKLTKDLESFFHQLNQDGHSIPTAREQLDKIKLMDAE